MVEADRGGHSAKPAVFRDLVERVGQHPRLELFGRQRQRGWVVWGNEIEAALFSEDVEEVT